METIQEEPFGSSRECLGTFTSPNNGSQRPSTPPAISPVSSSEYSPDSQISKSSVHESGPTYQDGQNPPEASLLHPAIRNTNTLQPWDNKSDVHPVIQPDKDEPSDGPERPQLLHKTWNPIWLHPVVLICFAVIFMLCAVATGLMYHFSEVDLGLSSQSEAHEYGWKYGPTTGSKLDHIRVFRLTHVSVVLVAMSLLWQMVDLSTRSLLPWQELYRGPSSAEKTLLLDYLSPILPKRLWIAIKNRHWSVVATTTGHLLLLLLTVFSTGLLALESTEVTQQNVQFVAAQINASNYNLANVTATAASLFYGVQFQNLSYPLGTTPDTVVPTFTLQDQSARNRTGPNGSTYHASVPGVTVDFQCETLDIKNGTKMLLPWFSIRSPFFAVNVTTPSCTVLNSLVGEGPDHGYSHVPNATQNYQGWARNVVCNGGYDYSLPNSGDSMGVRGIGPTPVANATADNRVLITVTDLRYDPNGDVPEFIWIEDITALLCKPSYSINTYQVSYSGDFSTIPGATINQSGSTGDQIPGFPQGDLGGAVLQSAYQLYLGPGGDDYVLSRQVDTFFQMNQLLENNATLKTFMDPSILSLTSSTTFKGIATQLLYKMMQPGNPNRNSVAGSISYNQDRLHVKAPSTGVLCGGFALLFGISVAMVFIRPRNVVTREPGSVLATAEVLLSSPNLRNMLSGLGPARLSLLRLALHPWQFTSRWVPETGTFGIDPSTREEKALGVFGTQGFEWWRPFSTKAWFLGLAIAIPLTFIGVLEGIQHISDQQTGFVEVRARDSQVLASYIPATLAVCLIGMYSSIEYAVATFTPFATLREGNASASRSVSLTYLVTTRPHVWIQSLRNRHWALSIILATNFVAAFLTIVISGLYSEVDISFATTTNLQLMDKFDLSKTDISINDQRAGAINNLLTYGNISYPAWTYDSLAFPRLNISDSSLLGDTTPASLSLKAQATRASLNCTTMTDRAVAVEKIPVNTTLYQLAGMQNPGLFLDGYVILHVQGSLPWSLCDRPPPNATASARWHQYYYVRNDSTVSHVGKGTLLMWDLGDNMVMGDGIIETNPNAGEAATSASGITLDSYGCPSFAVTLGYASVTSSGAGNFTTYTADTDLGTLVCWQNVHQVETALTLGYPGLDISQATPPVVDESNAKSVQNPTGAGGPAFGFPVNNMMLTLQSIAPDNGVWNDYDYPDVFVNALVSGKDGVPLSQLAGHNNTDALQAAAQRIYGRYMAQAMSNNMRVDMDSELGQESFTTPTAGSASFKSTVLSSTGTSSPTIGPSSSASLSSSSSSSSAMQFVKATEASQSSVTATASQSNAASTVVTTVTPSSVTATITARDLGSNQAPPQVHARADTTTSSPTYSAQLSRNGATTRLQQNRGPKIALQVMLGVMVLGAIITILLMKVREILPHEPYTIAGLATLIVDGGLDGSSSHVANNGPYRPVSQLDMVDDHDQGEKWRSYSMGWWTEWDGTDRFGIRRLDVGVDGLLLNEEHQGMAS